LKKFHFKKPNIQIFLEENLIFYILHQAESSAKDGEPLLVFDFILSGIDKYDKLRFLIILLLNTESTENYFHDDL